MRKKKRLNFTTFAILTTITLLTWVIFDAWQRLNKIEFAEIPPAVLAPLNPSLNSAALDNIEKRKHFEREEIERFVPVQTVVEPAPEASPGAQEPAQASPSAQTE